MEIAPFHRWTSHMAKSCSARCEREMTSMRDEEGSACPMDSMYGNMLFCQG